MGFIIGENLNKIHAERKKVEGQMEVKISPKLTSVKREDAPGKSNKAALKYNFNFLVDYGKEGGNIEIDGEIVYVDTAEVIKDLEDEWKKDKNIKNEQLRIAIMNRVLEVGYRQAIPMADQIKLPLPLQLPRFSLKPPEETKEKAKEETKEESKEEEKKD
jgi:copper chaperone CopZ